MSSGYHKNAGNGPKKTPNALTKEPNKTRMHESHLPMLSTKLQRLLPWQLLVKLANTSSGSTG
jgi:hypothetical protein